MGVTEEDNALVLRIHELEATLRDAPMYNKGDRTADFCERYMRWFRGERLKVLLETKE